MSNYHCYAGDNYLLGEFPGGSVGLDAWFDLLRQLPNLSPNESEDPLRTLRVLHSQRSTPLAIPCPRVFISHRQIDKAPALRAAWLANGEGFDYWLDILDPGPAAAGLSKTLTPYQQAVLMAAIIELALLNCTHVLAVMTKNVPGTMWIPYEYGRVKDSALISIQAAGWFDSTWTLANTPEYFHLGPQWRTELELRTWFQRELAGWRLGNPQAYCPPKLWPFGEMPPFPETYKSA